MTSGWPGGGACRHAPVSAVQVENWLAENVPRTHVVAVCAYTGEVCRLYSRVPRRASDVSRECGAQVALAKHAEQFDIPVFPLNGKVAFNRAWPSSRGPEKANAGVDCTSGAAGARGFPREGHGPCPGSAEGPMAGIKVCTCEFYWPVWPTQGEKRLSAFCGAGFP